MILMACSSGVVQVVSNWTDEVCTTFWMLRLYFFWQVVTA
jgi:hypothetical protein